MTETPKSEHDLVTEIRNLGNNLKEVLQRAWESEETQKYKEEIKNGLTELGEVVKEASKEFTSGEAGQRIRTEAEEVRERIRSGEMEAKAREELFKVLNTINKELEMAADTWFTPKEEEPSETEDES